MHRGKRQAGIDAAPVQQHRAGAALAVVAAFLGSRQPEMLTKRIEQGRARIETQDAGLTVDLKFDCYRR
jgi:hypothetical protein